MNVVEKYYGKEIFYEDAFNEVAGEAYEEALKENNIDAVSRPNIEVSQIEKGKNLIFTAVVETKPEVKAKEDIFGMDTTVVESNVVLDETSTITASTVLTGNLASAGSFDIQGTVNGNVTCNGKLVVPLRCIEIPQKVVKNNH